MSLRPARVLSALVAALATVASAGGLAWPRLYRDNAWVTSAWRGSDLVTLLFAVPLLVAALIRARGGARRPLLVWLGMLAYMLYGYAFYLFGAAFNAFFLLYVAIVAFSLLALVFSLPRIDAAAIAAGFRPGAAVRFVAGYLLLVGAGVGAAWIALCLRFVFTGRLPQVIVDSGHPTSVVFALDLGLLVPGFLLGGLWLWRRRPWGYVLGAMMSIKGATYTLALGAAATVGARAGIAGAAGEIPVWLSFTALGLLSCALLLRRLSP